jgi:fucose permease
LFIGCGALVAPLSATYFAQSTTNWTYHYLISLSLAVSNMLILAGVFRFQSQDGTPTGPFSTPKEVKYNTYMVHFITACLRRAGEVISDEPVNGEIHGNDGFTQIMKNKTVHLLALFLMIYIGVEVTIGGMIFVDYKIVTSLITAVNQIGL